MADVVSLPTSRINAFERSVTGDLLVEMLRLASHEDRKRVAARLAPLAELPNALARMLLRDEPDIAGLLIEQCASLSDADLVACIRDAGPEHRFLMANRRALSEVVTETLMSFGETQVIEAVLRNTTARLSQVAVEGVVSLSRTERGLCPHLLRRPELRPSGAYVMFWWCEPDDRRTILQRFAVSREVMQEVAEDVFAMAAEEKWQDPVSRKALQFIERRQRNRGAVETGLAKSDLQGLWRSMRRPETVADGSPHPTWERVQVTYDMLAVDRAQTVLRYWNWSLSSALTPALLRAIRDGDEDEIDDYSAPERAAMLALAENFGR